MAEHDQRPSTDRGSVRQRSGDHEAAARRADRTTGTTTTAPKLDDASGEGPAERLQQEVCEASARIRRRAGENLEEQKSRAALLVDDLGGAIHRAADELRDRRDERTADWAEALSEQLRRASRYLADRDLRRIGDDLGAATRRRPGVAIGGLFVAGIAAARFLKASRERARDERPEGRGATERHGADRWTNGDGHRETGSRRANEPHSASHDRGQAPWGRM